jgi:REP element-mobilizing transposase RayT
MPEYDYAALGAYFVTVCAYEGAHIFGNIRKGVMELNAVGKIVRNEWLKTAELRPNIRLDEFVVMPNHFHAVVWIVGRGRIDDVLFCRGTARRAPTKQNIGPIKQTVTPSRPYRTPVFEQFGQPVIGSIPTIVRSFKSAVTNRARAFSGARDQIWQRNYHERVIRDDQALWAIRKYIRDNPLNWAVDG